MRPLDVLVHLRRYDGEPPSARAALLLAEHIKVALHGLYVAPLPPAAFTSPESMAVLVEESDRRCRDARDASGWWRELLDRHRTSGDWQVALSDPIDAIAFAARWSNLIVMERPMQNPDAPVGWGLVSRTVLEAGSPVLVVPDNAPLVSVGRIAAFAWNGSRGAIRAVHGALPVLAKAEKVVVLDGAGPEPGGSLLQMPRFDLGAHLSRHGIAAEFSAFAPGNDKAAAILAAAHAAGADLLVMGAWGRSRLTELVIGGTTRKLFQQTDLPLLVAH